MDKLDKRLLTILQEGLPISQQPFRDIGDSLGVKESEIIERVSALREAGMIRRLGGVFDSPAMGLESTLCALMVQPEEVEEVAAVINKYPEVTHNYLRDDQLNMWFTVTAHSREDVSRIMSEIEMKTGLKPLSMPVIKRYKIKVVFPFNDQ